MKIRLNGRDHDTAATTLSDLLAAEGLASGFVATAVNGAFVPRGERPSTPLREGDAVEVVSPRQGG